MEFSPSQLEDLARKADEAQGLTPWASEPNSLGQCIVSSGVDGWYVALKVVRGPDGAPAVEQLRVFREERFYENADRRVEADRAFWLDGHEDALLDELGPEAWPTTPAGGITTTLLRRLPWGRMFRGAKQDYGDFLAVNEVAIWDEPVPTRAGGPDRGDRFYAERAAEYLDLVMRGDRRPVDVMAERHGYGRETAAGWLKQARARGLLVSAGRGRAGGALTDRARELLEEEHG